MSDHEPDPDRQQQIVTAVLKFLGITVAVCLAIGLVTWVVVKSLDLNNDGTGTSGSVSPVQPITPLPTTALPSPTDSNLPSDTSSPSDGDTDSIPPFATESPGSTALFLSASPVSVQSEQRINLTGSWPGHDSVSLLVQRFENGAWADFGVQVEVDIGTFATFVETGHAGDNKFRVYDPSSGTASNAVTVAVGQ
ncbi:MAG TPA: hypothetical protein VHZ06_05110 [Marmoricola sp.]|nr:hypothetical protein [Marmoricola sp.]